MQMVLQTSVCPFQLIHPSLIHQVKKVRSVMRNVITAKMFLAQ
jgi:hypothetical protein